MRSRARSPMRPTTGVLSPRKAVTKREGTSSAGRVAQVAALQAVQIVSSTYSPEYSPASPSPPRYRVTGAKVGRGKVLTPPLDRSGVDSPPDTVRHHIKQPPIRGPPEIHAYTDTEDEDDEEEEEEEPTDVASLRAQLAALRLCLNYMDERVAESEIDWMELGDWIDTLRKAVCSKIKCLEKAIGNEDLYRSPDPK